MEAIGWDTGYRDALDCQRFDINEVLAATYINRLTLEHDEERVDEESARSNGSCERCSKSPQDELVLIPYCVRSEDEYP